MSGLKELSERILTVRAEFLAKGENLFRDAALELFQKYPKLESFGWEQWSPYFNDGDPCLFSVHEYTLKLNGWNPDDDEDEVAHGFTNDEYKAIMKDAWDLISLVPEDIIQEMFGDDVKVTVLRNGGIEKDETSHD